MSFQKHLMVQLATHQSGRVAEAQPKGNSTMKKILLYPTFILLLLASVWFAPAYAAKLPTTLSFNPQPALQTASQPYVGDLWQRTELYFGSQKPDGETVTEAEFEQFVDDIITPRFPAGLTLLTGYGQFRNANNVIVEEQSFVLILLYPLDDKAANGAIEEIRETYKESFAQESVLRGDSLQRVSF
jgi:hypothetical protein